MTLDKKILEVENLKRYFEAKISALSNKKATVYAVDDVCFEVGYGETLGLVGESGCGKSTVGRTITRLLDGYPGLSEGKVIFEGVDLLKLDQKELKPYRKELQFIFQDPYSSLNPKMTIGNMLMEPLNTHKYGEKEERREKVIHLLEEVGFGKNPEDTMSRYPHEFSGGQRQRIVIARALTLDPKLVIADEPVSALDVSIQAKLLNLMKSLKEKRDMSYVFISHDLHVIENFCDSIAVMYVGKIVEIGSKEDVFHNTKHHYTAALKYATPVIDVRKKPDYSQMLSGDVPSPINPPKGCRFHTRCNACKDICKEKEPEMVGDKHKVACHFPIEKG